MGKPSSRPWLGLVLTLALSPLACSAEMKILLEATKTASTVFKDAKDDARVKRDAIASKRLGELAGSNRLTIEELQPLKAAVASAKVDGKVTLDEADQILIEMERIAALHSSR